MGNDWRETRVSEVWSLIMRAEPVQLEPRWGTRRAIDLRENDALDADAFVGVIIAAVAVNRE
ncbi:hypothetical protein ACPXCG_09050 [Gordonia sp. DT218]|uniref:hypothetical protein n=1 Tax=Gordonia sp. DT218 TaxID=3416659 RepID=UPI003CF884CA